MKSLLLVVAAGLAVSVSGCSSEPEPTPAPTPVRLEGVWGSSNLSETGVTLNEDGTFLAHDQCQLSGTWTNEGLDVTFIVTIGAGPPCRRASFDDLATGTITDAGRMLLSTGRGAEIEVLRRAPQVE